MWMWGEVVGGTYRRTGAHALIIIMHTHAHMCMGAYYGMDMDTGQCGHETIACNVNPV